MLCCKNAKWLTLGSLVIVLRIFMCGILCRNSVVNTQLLEARSLHKIDSLQLFEARFRMVYDLFLTQLTSSLGPWCSFTVSLLNEGIGIHYDSMTHNPTETSCRLTSWESHQTSKFSSLVTSALLVVTRSY